jgi:hypothetical protein
VSARRSCTVASPALTALLAGCLLAGCGLAGCGGFAAPDLFVVRRSGSDGAAALTLVVNEEGGVRCNGARGRRLSDSQLVRAREIQEALVRPTASHVALPARPGSVFAYRVRDEAGSARFADNSTGQPQAFRKLALFVLEVGERSCHLPR